MGSACAGRALGVSLRLRLLKQAWTTDVQVGEQHGGGVPARVQLPEQPPAPGRHQDLPAQRPQELGALPQVRKLGTCLVVLFPLRTSSLAACPAPRSRQHAYH